MAQSLWLSRPTGSTTRSRPSSSPKCIASRTGRHQRLRNTLPSWRHSRLKTQLQAAAVDLDDNLYSGESFYDILGVRPEADGREIKRAYFNMMRECHPDLSQDETESTEFCKMLNEIYETLTDPARRAVYDDLVGFSDYSVNPFLNTDYPRDQVFVDEFSCIGCRNCNAVCPKTFTIEEEHGRARAIRQGMDSDEKLQEAIDTCPVSCIHWVSAPQLSLLEASMARMERVAVWSLMSGGGANKDVFTEASLAWEKRQGSMRARRRAAEQPVGGMPGASSPFSFWSNIVNFEGATGSRFYQQTQAAGSKRRGETSSSSGREGEGASDAEAGVTDKETRGIAVLAARAARASRSWKVYQEVSKAKRGGAKALVSLSSASLSSVDEADVLV